MITKQRVVTNGSGKNLDLQRRSDQGSREQALVAAAQAGMAAAMDELLARHKTVLYRAARRFTNCHEDAEDLVQEAMLRAFLNVRRFRNESQFATWLIAIVNNAALSMKRKGKGIHFVSLDHKDEASGGGQWDMPDVRENPEDETVLQELVALLHAITLRQPRTPRRLLEQCVFNEARIRDAASSLGLTIASAKSSLFRARRRVADSFKRHGLVKNRNLQATWAQ